MKTEKFSLQKYKAGQAIYEVAINVLSGEPNIEQHIILHVGTTALFAHGRSAEWGGGSKDTTFSFCGMGDFDKNEILARSSFCTWTDSAAEAEKIRAEACRILQNRKAIIQ